MTRASTPEHIRYDASGLSFAALAWGDPDAPLALCLHGYPDTAWTWREVGPRIAQRGWRVVAPFARGYGPSDLAPDGAYQVGALARDAIEAHRALGGDDRAVLIGHDWGAIATYAAGAHSPSLYSRMVTMAVPPPRVAFASLMHPKRVPFALRQLRGGWYVLFQQLPWISERLLPRIVPRLWADWSPGYDATEDLRHVEDALTGPGRRTAALRYYRAMVQPWYRKREYAAEQKHWLHTPAVPTLYLHGAQDGCALAPMADAAAAALSSGSRAMTLPGVGHFLHLEDPDTVAALIGDFIEH